MRDSQRMAVIGGVAAVVVGATGFGVYALVGEDESGAGDGHKVASADGKNPAEQGPLSAEEVRTAAGEFLDAWSAGDGPKAAALTDDEQAATKALAAFGKEARVSQLKFTPGKASKTDVPFGVKARITHGGQRAAWSYDSRLEVVRDKKSGEAVVRWEPAVLHPKLKKGQSVETGEAGTPPIKAVDRNGTELTKDEHPSLAGTLADLRKRYGAKTDGTPGIETRIVDSKGKDTGTTLRTLSKGEPGTLKTTLDLPTQQAAEAAIADKPKAAVVAVKPSTGEILALANSPAEGFNTALQGSYAPGSTMKVVTAAMLLDKGLAVPAKQHPCPKYFTYGHWKFQNDDKFEIKGGTFSQSFARSCNTAFISQAPELEDDSLTKEARDVFGIGLNWQTGTATFDGKVPVQSDAQMGASLIGQGGVRMNPLTMASVSATVKSGVFKQPYLVSPSLDDRTFAKAPRTMKPQVADDLRQLMRTTATGGTAAEAMAGASGDFGAKTGSAEVDGQKKPNAWFTAYRDDVAAAAVVPASGHGGEYAGPVVRKVLDAG
ncbi:penicillin-binding protein [Streptomyces sp. N2-109]|uniref:Penicillin-binding protein n=1 Tax=Streptomyces gossypii TaxID=2883101 RepID=A0ABT2JZF9_9ACTN|nr:penicillin-binding transpeptidase domain-containing protein [Streptomyces gossypii]MCT2593043.1 penicillin-binding protein [Streptomyces gossypii]